MRTKRLLSFLLSAVLLAGLLSTGAMAAVQPIGVDVNGRALAFTAGAPEQVDGRTYVPARTVFEALGAVMRYIAAEERIVIERNGVSLSMVLGANEYTCSEHGLTTTMPMAGAAYLRNGLAYVPVRDAAEALGLIVGWDNHTHTVILIDPQPLAEEAAANYQYRLLEGYNDYAARFGTGTWECGLTMAMTASMMAVEIMKLDVDANGVVANSSKGEMSMTMNLDMSGLANLVEMLNAFTGEQMAVGPMPEEAVMEVAVETRMDMAEGKIYLLIDGLPEESGLPADTWLCMDLDELMATNGQIMALNQMMELSGGNVDIVSLIAGQVRLANINSQANAMENVRATADAAAALFADSSFTKDGSVYTLSRDAEGVELTVRLTVDENDTVTGYAVEMDMSAALSDLAAVLGDSAEELLEYGAALDDAVLILQASMDEENVMKAVLELRVGDLFGVELNMDGKYTATDRTPESQPPEGAQVVDYFELLAQ